MYTILFLLLLVLLSGCTKAPEEQGVRLYFWSSTNSYEIQFAQEIITQWNKAHPDTTVVMQPLPEGRSGEEVLIIAAAGGTTPDICANVPPVIVPLLAKANALIPVDEFEDGRSYLADRIPEELYKTFIADDGKLYQIPWKGNPILVQYNTGMLKKYGVTKLPETWSEFFDVAEKVRVDLDGDGQADQWLAHVNVVSEWRQRLFDFYTFYIAASGGGTLLKDGAIDFDNEVCRSVFNFFREGFIRDYFPNSIFAGDMFLDGRFSAHVTGPWNIAHVDHLKSDDFEYDFGPIPVPDDYVGEKYTFGDPKSIGIFSTSKHPQAAWNFTKFFISHQADVRLLEITNQLPLRKSLLEDSLFTDYFANNPMMIKFAERVPYTRGFDQSIVMQEIFDAINSQFDAVCIQGRREVEDGVERAVKRSQRVKRLRGGEGSHAN